MAEFSVCVPTYNGAEYLCEAIESVLRQGFSGFELLICDDGSTDATPDLVAGFRDPRIRFLRFGQNLGQAGNFNRCIENARGEFWTLLSADDRLLPDFLERAQTELRARPEVGFFVPASNHIDERGDPTQNARPWPEKRVVRAGELLPELLQGAHITTLGLVVRRESLARVGPFRTDVSWGHDWDWILRLVAVEGGVYVPEALTEYREHMASGTTQALRAGTNGASELVILREALGRAQGAVRGTVVRSALRAFAIRQLYFADATIKMGSPSAATTNLRHAVAAAPWVMTRFTFWSLAGRAWFNRVRRPAAPRGEAPRA